MRIDELEPATAPEHDLARWYRAQREQHDEMDADEPFPPWDA